MYAICMSAYTPQYQILMKLIIYRMWKLVVFCGYHTNSYGTNLYYIRTCTHCTRFVPTHIGSAKCQCVSAVYRGLYFDFFGFGKKYALTNMYANCMSAYAPPYQILMKLVIYRMWKLVVFCACLCLVQKLVYVSVLSIVACILIFLDLVKNIHSPRCLPLVCEVIRPTIKYWWS